MVHSRLSYPLGTKQLHIVFMSKESFLHACLREREREYWHLFIYIFWHVHTRERGEGIETCDLRFIRRSSQSIELPIGDKTASYCIHVKREFHSCMFEREREREYWHLLFPCSYNNIFSDHKWWYKIMQNCVYAIHMIANFHQKQSWHKKKRERDGERETLLEPSTQRTKRSLKNYAT